MADEGLFDSTLVVTATYNEIENLPRLVDEIQKHAPGCHLLIIDDNSPDGTGKWAQERAATDSGVSAIVREGKQGLGSAILLAMQYAMEHSYAYLVNLDADFSHAPNALPRILESMDEEGGRDVVIGSRYIDGGGVSGWPLRRRLMSRGVNLYARNFLRLSVRDCSGGYRCFRVSKLREFDLSNVEATGYAFHEEILYHLRLTGARFGETPIIFTDRRYGQSKINMKEAFIALWIIFKLSIRRER
jgi:dolichol-phosphate mannosyltransferase